MSECLSLALILASCHALAASVILSNAGCKISSHQALLPLLFKALSECLSKTQVLLFNLIPDLHLRTFPFASENVRLLLSVEEIPSSVSFSSLLFWI